MERKAQSQVVTAVLLILIVIALAVLILNFSTNFVKDKLSGTSCFEVVGQVGFTNSNKYTCYDRGSNKLNLQVHLGDVSDTLDGFLLESGGASTTSVEIKEGATVEGVVMYDGSETLEIPGKSEERTYVMDVGGELPETVKIYPILNDGNVCEASDVLESIVLCK